MATTPTKLMTFAEFKEIPESGPRFELHHGELIEMAEVIWRHYTAQGRLRDLLREAAGDSGYVDIEFAFRALAEYEYRRADIAFAARERIDMINPMGHFLGAPDLVIEILSPSNTISEMRDKKRLCLENGSVEFWEVDLDYREVEVSTRDGHAITYRTGQSIPLFFAPGKQIAVDAIFA